MKKRILPILLLILPFLYWVIIRFGIAEKTNINRNMLILLIIWVILFVLFFIANTIFVVFSVCHGEKSEFFLFWNMLMKLLNIPMYILVFFIGLIFAALPGAIIFAPFLIAFDYMLLILTSIYGIGGLVQARREKKITTTAFVVLGILHFVFCTDVICAIISFCKVKSKRKNA